MHKRSVLLEYVFAVAATGLATCVELSIRALRIDAPYVLYFGAVVASAWYGGIGPALLAAVLSTFAIAWLVIPPSGALTVSEPRTLAGLAAYALVAIATGMLHGRLRRANRELTDERARVEATLAVLRESEERISRILGSITDGFFVFDRDWRFLFANAQAAAIARRGVDDLIGRRLPDVFPELAAMPYWSEFERAMRDQVVVHLEEYFPPLDLWFETTLYPAEDGLSGIVRDVSRRRDADAALRDREERLQLAIEAGKMGTWDWDPATNRVRWSERLEVMYGMAPGSFDGTFESYLAAIHPDDREAARLAVQRSAARGGEHFVRHRVLWPDGSVHWVEGRGIVVRDAEGRIVRMVGVTIDVTERERARELSERLHQNLERRVAERTQALLETVSELEAFSYSISHDLRAPVRAVRGYADAILDEAGTPDSDPGLYARRIVEAADHMDALIEDLLAYSRVTRAELDLEPLELHAVVDDVLGHIPDLNERADVRVMNNGDMPRVLGHRATLFQALTNLVSNALKFVPPGTHPSVRIRAERRGGRVRLWVEDNGIGIAPEHHERIFRVFERLHGRERYPGTGVGLAIVRKAVERMGGATGVESRPGAGSRFWIELPAGPAEATTPDGDPADRARPAAHLQGS